VTNKVTRKIISIDEEKCNGCGAKLISETFCDGLGACLGECPQGAITIEERVAEGFDEAAVKRHLEKEKLAQERLPCGCPSTTVTQFAQQEKKGFAGTEEHLSSGLSHWPVQLTLVPPTAPFLQEARLVLAADCVPFAYADFHQSFLENHSLLVACPKLDDFQTHLEKLTEILRRSEVKGLMVVHMEVPCCSGLVHSARRALKLSGKNIPLEEITISIRGEILEWLTLTSPAECKCPS